LYVSKGALHYDPKQKWGDLADFLGE